MSTFSATDEVISHKVFLGDVLDWFDEGPEPDIASGVVSIITGQWRREGAPGTPWRFWKGETSIAMVDSVAPTDSSGAVVWDIGDLIWRGYARFHNNSQEWWPEVRAGYVRAVKLDGTYEINMVGIIPGREAKRTHGMWVHYGCESDIMNRTPQEALAQALRAVEQAKKERPKQDDPDDEVL
jgi:hypothetical protein